MAAKFSDLVTYFRTLAEKHVDIKHTATAKHFYRFELDEVLTGMCGNIKYPALILEAYDFNYSENGSDNIRKKRSGAFIIIDKVSDMKDFDKIHALWDKCEEIGDDILIKMRDDKESGLYPILREFNINECNGIPLSVAQLGQHGMRFSFNLGSAVSNVVNQSKWL
jgi:hypothetical protein